MAFNVNSFRSSFSIQGEPTSSSAFEVRMMGYPLILPSSTARELTFRCEGASIPGKNLTTVDRRTYGTIRKIATGVMFDEIALTFIVSSSIAERNFFSAWQSLIIDPSQGGDITYYDDYVGTIQIVTYDHKGNENLQITLIEAYPISIVPINLGWDMKQEYMKLQVVFAYRYAVDQQGSAVNGLNSLLGTIGKSAQLLNNLKNLKSQIRKGGIGSLGAVIAAAGSANQLLDQATGAAGSLLGSLPGVSSLGGGFAEAVSSRITETKSFITSSIGSGENAIAASFKQVSGAAAQTFGSVSGKLAGSFKRRFG